MQTANAERAGTLWPRSGSRPRHSRPISRRSRNSCSCRPPRPRSSSRRVQELVARLDEHERLAVERESSSEQYRNQLASAARTEADIRAELAERENSHRVTAETLSAEKATARGAAQAGGRGARPAAARHRRHEAGGRDHLGDRAHGERRDARAHQRRGRRGGAAHRRAGRAELADRGHPGRRSRPRPTLAAPTAPPAKKATANADRGDHGATAAARRARSPTASAPCRTAARAWRSRAEARRHRRGAANPARPHRLTSATPAVNRRLPRDGRLAQRESVPFTRERS